MTSFSAPHNLYDGFPQCFIFAYRAHLRWLSSFLFAFPLPNQKLKPSSTMDMQSTPLRSQFLCATVDEDLGLLVGVVDFIRYGLRGEVEDIKKEYSRWRKTKTWSEVTKKVAIPSRGDRIACVFPITDADKFVKPAQAMSMISNLQYAEWPPEIDKETWETYLRDARCAIEERPESPSQTQKQASPPSFRFLCATVDENKDLLVGVVDFIKYGLLFFGFGQGDTQAIKKEYNRWRMNTNAWTEVTKKVPIPSRGGRMMRVIPITDVDKFVKPGQAMSMIFNLQYAEWPPEFDREMWETYLREARDVIGERHDLPLVAMDMETRAMNGCCDEEVVWFLYQNVDDIVVRQKYNPTEQQIEVYKRILMRRWSAVDEEVKKTGRPPTIAELIDPKFSGMSAYADFQRREKEKVLAAIAEEKRRHEEKMKASQAAAVESIRDPETAEHVRRLFEARRKHFKKNLSS
jgi:hypothetical protein